MKKIIKAFSELIGDNFSTNSAVKKGSTISIVDPLQMHLNYTIRLSIIK
jgi:hypothetical protein